jgi:hypothetical protein
LNDRFKSVLGKRFTLSRAPTEPFLRDAPQSAGRFAD